MRQKFLFRPLALAAVATLSSCVGNGDTAQIPLGNWETEAALVASPTTATPDHTLSKIEYPFDADGNYIAAWAAGNVESIEVAPKPAEMPVLVQIEDSTQPVAKTNPNPAAKDLPVVSGSRYHKVSASDTLWGLSQKYGTTVSAIQRANGLDDTKIRTGSTIKIPG
ncbi:MAG: LysM peptidoglycan-binding domain-containing protein [Verrucomicrobiales bacterium]